jgi:N-carbamoylputrescine amidase
MARVALAQFSGHQDTEVNVRKAEDLARQAAGNGAQIVCFPELCTTIYFCFDRSPKYFALAEPVPGPSVDRMRRVAWETGTVLVYPLYENDGGTLYNTAAVIGPDGELIGK